MLQKETHDKVQGLFLQFTKLPRHDGFLLLHTEYAALVEEVATLKGKVNKIVLAMYADTPLMIKTCNSLLVTTAHALNVYWDEAQKVFNEGTDRQWVEKATILGAFMVSFAIARDCYVAAGALTQMGEPNAVAVVVKKGERGGRHFFEVDYDGDTLNCIYFDTEAERDKACEDFVLMLGSTGGKEVFRHEVEPSNKTAN